MAARLEDFSDAFFGSRINHGDAAVVFAKAYKDLLGRSVIADVVGIGAEINALAQRVGPAVKNVELAVARVGHEELVKLRNIERTLRFGHATDAVDDAAGEDIDNLDGVVA